MLFGTAANGSETYHVPSGETTYGRSVRVTWADPPNQPLGGVSTSWSVSPNNGVTLDHAHRTDGDGYTWFRLTFGANACGTYTVTMWLPDHSSGATYQARIVYSKPCSSGTSSSSSGTTAPTKLFIVSGDNQTGIIGEPLADPFVVRVRDRDQDNKPLEGVKVTFTVLTGGGALSTTTTTTDINGLAKSTLTLGDEPGTNSVEVRAEGVSKEVIFRAEATLPPPVPTMLSIISGDNQTGLTGEPLANPFVVEVRDQRGDPMEGVTVTLAVTAGDGSLSTTTAITDANGQAATTLRLSTEAGTHTIEVSAEGISETVTFTAEAMPPTLTSVSGDNQSAAAGTTLANPFVVEVRDANGTPLAGVAVTFVVLTGGGTLSATTGTTDASGHSESTLTLGNDPGTNTVEVSAEGISETVTFTAEAIPPTLTSVSGDNQVAAVGTALANPFVVEVRDGNGSPLAGIAVTFVVRAGGSRLSAETTTTDANGQAFSTLRLGIEPGANTVEVSAEGISEIVTFTAVAELLEFDLALSAGFNLIHLPLHVRIVNGMPTTIQSIADLYDALGGADTVHWLTTHDSHTQTWYGYFGDADRGRTADSGVTDQTGILANMRVPVSVRLGGNALGTDGSSLLTLNRGSNLVGLPLEDARINRVSDLFTLDGLGGNALMIIVANGGEFKLVGRAGDPGDMAVIGGQGFIISVQRAAEVHISGEGWSDNSDGF